MKSTLFVSMLLAAAPAFAAQTTSVPNIPLPDERTEPAQAGYSPYSPLSSRIEERSRSTDNNGHPYDQILSITAGPYQPKQINFTNWNSTTFNYDTKTLKSFSVELGWGINLFRAGGTAFSFSEGLTLSSFTFQLPDSMPENPGNQSVTLHMFGFDSRIQQSWQTFPVASLEPFWEGGYRLSLYNQSAPSDLLSGEGTTGNFVAGLGMRWWVNRGASLNHEFPNRYMALPVFVSAKLNQIFSNNQGVDPGSTSVMAGISIGL
jgi:hypothetical protein